MLFLRCSDTFLLCRSKGLQRNRQSGFWATFGVILTSNCQDLSVSKKAVAQLKSQHRHINFDCVTTFLAPVR